MSAPHNEHEWTKHWRDEGHRLSREAAIPAAMTAADVAAELQIDERTFFARRPRLQRDYGFPRALPGCMLRWSRSQILTWINNGGELPPDDMPPALAPPRLVVDNAHDLLTRRYVETCR